jgi:predicted ABC-type ATPase
MRIAAVIVLLGLAGCGKTAVRASEKEFLADQVMVFDDDPNAAAADDHINSNREGAAGGHGTGGGGCGCN